MKTGLKHYSLQTQMQILKSINGGMKPSEAANKYEVARSTIYRWIDRDSGQNGMGLQRKGGNGRKSALTLDEINQILAHMSNLPSDYGFETDLWTTTEVRILIKDKLKKTVHRSTVYRMLTEKNYSSKKVEARWSEADKDAQKTWLEKTVPTIKRYVSRHDAILYFCDESSISLTPSQGRTWGPKGKTTIIKRTGKRGRLNAISAISPSNKLVFSIKRESIGSDQVILFLKQILKNHPSRTVVVVLDNCSAHKSLKIRQFQQKTKNLKLYFLPTYSPEWNPDEKVWNHLKSIELMGHTARDIDTLEIKARSSLQKMARRPKLLRGIFMRCEIAKFFI